MLAVGAWGTIELHGIEDTYDYQIADLDGNIHTFEADMEFHNPDLNGENLTPRFEAEWDADVSLNELNLTDDARLEHETAMAEELVKLDADTQGAIDKIEYGWGPFYVLSGVTVGAAFLALMLVMCTGESGCIEGFDVTCCASGADVPDVDPGVSQALLAGTQAGLEVTHATLQGAAFHSAGAAQEATEEVRDAAIPLTHLSTDPGVVIPSTGSGNIYGVTVANRRRLEAPTLCDTPSEPGLTLWQAAPILVMVPLLSSCLARWCISVYHRHRARKPAVRIPSRRPSDVLLGFTAP